ncbi:HEAVY METAL TRANSPORT/DETOXIFICATION SUPERFAMILY PROTEIN [Salix koriyanagi]|uniref:HEAVY METAL TRANSPORT/DETOXIFICATION SUPERFAMILY PROTEIN n=1 Tax=Salix koriyanagi TaxID=2511006 RepID=A0A9Q0ZUU8_9ROSI|nr:HEAVY METAL TRANSPORT/DETOXIFICATION SUPERFAMILY PROTEIN [Salix koriyanagi]
MAEKKVTTMVIKVDLECEKCHRKIKKVLCRIPQIQNQMYDKKAGTVTITVFCCSPEKVREKIICKGGEAVKSIEIKVPEKPKPAAPPAKTPDPAKTPAPPAKAPEPAKTPAPPAKAPEPAKTPAPPAKAPEPAKNPDPPAKAPEPAKTPAPPAKAPEPAKTPAPPAKAPEPAKTPAPPAPAHHPPAPVHPRTCCAECYQGMGGGPCYHGHGMPGPPEL